MKPLQFILYYSLQLLRLPEPSELALNIALPASVQIWRGGRGEVKNMSVEKTFCTTLGTNTIFRRVMEEIAALVIGCKEMASS